MSTKGGKTGVTLIADNRRARFDYELLDRVEAGVVLTGTEVKSLREGRVTLAHAYADIRDGEAWLVGASIDEYAQGTVGAHRPERDRKLLLHRREIARLQTQVAERGLTLVPLSLYWKEGRAKVDLAVVRGRRRYDKREAIRRREQDREVQRASRHGRHRSG